MKKALFSLLVLAIIALLLWVNYSGFFLLQGTWVCQNVDAAILPPGVGAAAFGIAGTFGATISLHFSLAKMKISASAFGSSSEVEMDYLAQTGRLIFDDFALHYTIKDDTLVLSNTAGSKLTFVKQ